MYWGPGKFGALLRKLQLNVPANVADDKQIFTSASRSIDHLEDDVPYTFPGIDIFVLRISSLHSYVTLNLMENSMVLDTPLSPSSSLIHYTTTP